MDKYFDKLNKALDDTTDEELEELLIKSGIKKRRGERMKAKYWLIYADWEGRKAKPFTDLEVMERWIEIIESNPSMTVIAKTQAIEDEQVTVDKDKMLKELMKDLHSKLDKELIEEYEKMGCKVKYTPGTKGEIIFKD